MTNHANAALAITRVEDSQGEPIANGGTTVDTVLKLSGTGAENAVVTLFENGIDTGITSSVTASGWDLPVTAILGRHSYTVRDSAGADSPPWVITVVAAVVKPLITNVTGANGPVSDGGSTKDTQLTIAGSGTPNGMISIHDEAGGRGEFPINAQGFWTTTALVFAASATPHSITAKVVGEPPISDPWRFTVTQSSVKPVIRTVTGANGEVSDGGSTRDTELTISGTGTPNATISIHDENGGRGEFLINPAGNWTTTALVFAASTTPHSVTAKEVGVPPISDPWRFTVLPSSVTPRIRTVTGANGEVANGGSTRDTELTISGTGTPNATISIHDENGGRGEFLINAAGNWTTSVLVFAVSATPHSVTAKEVGVPPISDPWRFTVTQSSVAPLIRSVTGANGSVANGGSTRDTQLTISGTGTPNATISIHDENGGRGEYPINASGNWTTSVLLFAVSATPHSVTAKEVGVPPISDPWRFTVTQSSVAPLIRSVTGTNGSVANGGSTQDTQLTISGTGTPNATISIHDENGGRGEYPINASGNWTTTVLAFAVSATAHSVTAKEVGVPPISDPWRFTVTQSSVRPEIRSVTGVNGSVANGGTTRDTQLTISGSGTPNGRILIQDENGSRGEFAINSLGGWTTSALVFAVSASAHSVTAKDIASGLISAVAWRFTVQQATLPIVIDLTPVTLNGRLYTPGAANPIAWPANTTVTRVPTSGMPPYTYSSSNAQVANSRGNGLVTAERNGTAVITVRDNAGQTASYSVTVTGVIVCTGLGNSLYTTAVANAQAIGKRIPSLGELREIHAQYRTNWPMGNAFYFSTDSAGGFPARIYILNLVTGEQSTAITTAIGGGFANAVAI